MTAQFTHGHALLIGVGAAAYARWSLPVTVQDMQALAACLLAPELCAYVNDADHLRRLCNADATRQAILDGLAWLAQQTAADADATAIVYYSGHGWLDETSGAYYLLPHDSDPLDLAGSALAATAFSAGLAAVKAPRLLVLVDSCHAAGMATAKDRPRLKLPPGFAPSALPEGVIAALKQGAGRAVFTSALGSQSSWVRPDGSLSVYTYHLIEALQGAGNRPGETLVKLSNLMNHLGQAVPASARALCAAEQTPFFDTATEDFAVALLRGGKGLPAAGWQAAPLREPPPAATLYQATQSGAGAIAQGANAVAAGAGGIAIGKVHGEVRIVRRGSEAESREED